jgi:glc operon protein GlcG
MFRRATRDFEDLVNKGRVTMTTLPAVTAFTPLKGGVPLVQDGQVVGAVGVSGAASADQDDEIAQAATDALAKCGGLETSLNELPAGKVVHIPAQAVSGAFSHGAALFESRGFKVHASRRDGPGEAEVHVADNDIFYVQQGSARFVTGGELVDSHVVAPDEIRGKSILHGEALTLEQGDVVIVPKGVPHLFEQVTAPFVYYVVKSAS